MNLKLLLLLILCSCAARVRRIRHAQKSGRREQTFNGSVVDAVEISIILENDTPYDIDDLVLIHKYNGLSAPHPKTHVLVFSGVKSKSFSMPQKVLTEIGLFALREDWWLLSWRFKRSAGLRCPCCAKEDQSCETWITDPHNAFGQFFMDPVSYVKIAGAAINIVSTSLSLGTATVASVAATTVLTDVITDSLTADQNTDGFKACGLGSIDFENSEAGQPVKIRITPNFNKGDRVTWVGEDNDIKEGIVGKIVELLDEDPADEYRVRAEFPLHKNGKNERKVFRFKVGSLRFTFRPGDIVATLDNSSEALGQVVGYSIDGFVGVEFGANKEWHKATALQPHSKSSSDPSGGMPEFKVETLLYKEGASGLQQGHGAASKDVRWGCSMKAKAMPCVVNSAVSEGSLVPITVTNRGSKTIRSFAVLHKFNGLDPATHVVDSDIPLLPGSSSWVKPRRDSAVVLHANSFCDGSKILADEGTTLSQCQTLVQEDSDCRDVFHSNGNECLCVRAGNACKVKSSNIGNSVYVLKDENIVGKRLVVKSEEAAIMASANSTNIIGSLKVGSTVTAAGSFLKDANGNVVIPIKPHGAIKSELVNILDRPDPSAVLTNIGFGFRNDWWTIAWTYDGTSEELCEVYTAMSMDFLSELVNNPEQKILNVGVSVAGMALGIPVLWSGVIDVGKYSVEKYVRNSNELGHDPKPAHKLFGTKLLNMLASTSSVRGYEKCNLSRKDVEKAKLGKPVEIIIHDDRVEIRVQGGEKSCFLEVAELSCLQSAECFETETCKKLNARTEFARPASIA